MTPRDDVIGRVIRDTVPAGWRLVLIIFDPDGTSAVELEHRTRVVRARGEATNVTEALHAAAHNAPRGLAAAIATGNAREREA